MMDAIEYERKTVGYIILLVLIIAGLFATFAGMIDQQGKQIATLEQKIEKLRLQNISNNNQDLLPIVENMINVLSNQTQCIKDIKNIIDFEYTPAVENTCTNEIDLNGVDVIENLGLENLGDALKNHPSLNALLVGSMFFVAMDYAERINR